MSSMSDRFCALLLVTALAGCTTSGPITDSIADTSGESGSGGNGGDNDPYSDMSGHIIRYDLYGGAGALPDSQVASGTADIEKSSDGSTAQISVSASGMNVPSSGTLEMEYGNYTNGQGTFLTVGEGDNFLIAGYETPFDSNRMAHSYKGYFVGGNRTAPDQITASATYNGEARGEFVHDRPHGGASGSNGFEGQYAGGLFAGKTNFNLTVTGGDATISGAITDLYVHIYQGVDSGYSNSDVPGQITLEQTSLSNGAYAGSAKLDIPGATTSAGSYQGAMFGKDAAETAGTFHTQGSIPMAGEGTVGINMIGYFGAAKN